MSSMLILTIGHSTRAIDDFLDILRAHSVKRVVDIRTIPRSRHNPQFNQESLSESLKESARDYIPMKQLGGLRHSKADSRNMVGGTPPSEGSRTICGLENSRRASTNWLG